MNPQQTTTAHFGKQGIGRAEHNDRTHVTQNDIDHIDKERTSLNEVLIRDQTDKFFEETFREAMEIFNEKQRRNSTPERQIDMEEYKQKNVYEVILQVGNVETAGSLSLNQKDRDKINSIMQVYMHDFRRRNPNLKILQAVVHHDEATPHMHLRYVGVAKNMKRGMSIQANRKQALIQQGYTNKNSRFDNPTIQFTRTEQARFKEICKEHGIQWTPSTRNQKHKYMTREQYIDWDKGMKELEAQKQDCLQELGEIEFQKHAYLQEQKKAQAAVDKYNKVNAAFIKTFNYNLEQGDFEALAREGAIQTIKDRLRNGDFER